MPRIIALLLILTPVLTPASDFYENLVGPVEAHAQVVPVKFTSKTPFHEPGTVYANLRLEKDNNTGRIHLLMNRKDEGIDVHSDIYESTSDDEGRTWSPLEKVPSLVDRIAVKRGAKVIDLQTFSDPTPQWHEMAKRLMITGKTLPYSKSVQKKVDFDLPIEGFYSIYDSKAEIWGAPRFLRPDASLMPEYRNTVRLSPSKWHELSNGEILMPIAGDKVVRVCRLAFDGDKLRALEWGNQVPGREPNLIYHEGKYYMCLRNPGPDFGRYGHTPAIGNVVSVSLNGLQFDGYLPLRFDTGELLESSNAQCHWLELGGGLFLTYTRDFTFSKGPRGRLRRSPLKIAQFDPATLRLIKRTEQILIPKETGDPEHPFRDLVNYGVCQLDNNTALLANSDFHSDEAFVVRIEVDH